MVTVKDIAKHASVSPATVSKVLNKKTNVAPKTVAAIELAMTELGYRRSSRGKPKGVSYGKKRSNRIALLTHGQPDAWINSPVYTAALRGVSRACNEKGITLVLSEFAGDSPMPKNIFAQAVDGVILFGEPTDPRIIKILRTHSCVQMLQLRPKHALWDYVSYNNSKVGFIAANYLLESGQRNVAVVSLKSELGLFGQRVDDFTQTIEMAGGTVLKLADNELVNEEGETQRVVHSRMEAAVASILSSKPAVRGVFLVADILAQSFYSELLRRSVKPDVDIKIISCNNEELLLSGLCPRPATIDIFPEQIGRGAVEQVLKRIKLTGLPQATNLLEPALVTGSPL